MKSRRPWTLLDYLLAPAAFVLTRVVRPAFDARWPEKTKYKYRVDGRTDEEKEERDHDRR